MGVAGWDVRRILPRVELGGDVWRILLRVKLGDVYIFVIWQLLLTQYSMNIPNRMTLFDLVGVYYRV